MTKAHSSLSQQDVFPHAVMEKSNVMQKLVWLRDAVGTCPGTPSCEMLEPQPFRKPFSGSILAWHTGEGLKQIFADLGSCDNET